MASDPKHRTTPSVLRKIAADHAFLEIGPASRGDWDTFSTRNIGFAVQRQMAAKYDGNAAKMRAETRGDLMRLLGVNPNAWKPAERAAFENFGLLASIIPDIPHWSPQEKQSLVDIIRAKASENEADYLRRLQQHAALRKAVLQLGSAGNK